MQTMHLNSDKSWMMTINRMHDISRYKSLNNDCLRDMFARGLCLCLRDRVNVSTYFDNRAYARDRL